MFQNQRSDLGMLRVTLTFVRTQMRASEAIPEDSEEIIVARKTPYQSVHFGA
jgi:hypothetical protein